MITFLNSPENLGEEQTLLLWLHVIPTPQERSGWFEFQVSVNVDVPQGMFQSCNNKGFIFCFTTRSIKDQKHKKFPQFLRYCSANTLLFIFSQSKLYKEMTQQLQDNNADSYRKCGQTGFGVEFMSLWENSQSFEDEHVLGIGGDS